MRVFFVLGFLAAFGSAGCGSDDSGAGPNGSGGAGGTDASQNEYPGGFAVDSCFGDCPNGECDRGRFFSENICSEVFPGPVDESSSYCGAQDGSYCFMLDGGDPYMFAVQCTAGKTVIRACRSGCGNSTGRYDCG